MRLVLTFAAVLAATPAAAQSEVPEAVKNAEACLRENAANAVRASSGAADAAAFLIDYLCAGPVETAARHARSTNTLAMLREMNLSEEMGAEED